MKIGTDEVKQAAATLQEYKTAKATLDQRIVANEEWFKMRHWQNYRRDDGGKLPSSGWLFNSILNKHADAMDNYPEPAVLPREQSDEETAKALSQVLPAVLERNNYEQTYSDAWWYKLKQGTGVKGIFWNPAEDDICIKKVDLLNLFWEPGVTDFQDSPNFFSVELVSNDELKEVYPNIDLHEGSQPSIDTAKYTFDSSVKTDGKSAVVDWYYKKIETKGEELVTVLHYCKFVNDIVLFASENEPEKYPNGYYEHGLYPFVPDIMFQEEGMPVGFGYIDAMKDAQESIDELDSSIQFNARLRSKPRMFFKRNSGVNVEDLSDYTKDFIEVTGDPNTVASQIPVETLDASMINYRDMKIQELKETSGNRDFNQGSTVSGVTAASAISMLQEAGNKLSRDAIKSSYRAFVKECEMIIELIRQFYTEQRVFRITEPNGSYEFVKFDNSGMQPVDQGKMFDVELGARLPVYDIKVSAQKQSPFNQISQNQFVLELYNQGFFNPQFADQAKAAITLMEFEGKDKILQTIGENSALLAQIQQQQGQIQQMSDIINATTGAQLNPQAEQPEQEEGMNINDDSNLYE